MCKGPGMRGHWCLQPAGRRPLDKSMGSKGESVGCVGSAGEKGGRLCRVFEATLRALVFCL